MKETTFKRERVNVITSDHAIWLHIKKKKKIIKKLLITLLTHNVTKSTIGLIVYTIFCDLVPI